MPAIDPEKYELNNDSMKVIMANIAYEVNPKMAWQAATNYGAWTLTGSVTVGATSITRTSRIAHKDSYSLEDSIQRTATELTKLILDDMRKQLQACADRIIEMNNTYLNA